jgi:hypothetical protein
MAALDIILRLLKPGDEVIAGDDIYGGTNRLLTYLKVHGGVVVHHVDTTDPDSIRPLLKLGKTAMVLLESPTNPLLKIADLATISKDVKEGAPDAIIVVDNTMMSPYLQRPLEHGADIVYDSATKYLSGHHDLMAGVITCNRDDLATVSNFHLLANGVIVILFSANGFCHQLGRQCSDARGLLPSSTRHKDSRRPDGSSTDECALRGDLPELARIQRTLSRSPESSRKRDSPTNCPRSRRRSELYNWRQRA